MTSSRRTLYAIAAAACALAAPTADARAQELLGADASEVSDAAGPLTQELLEPFDFRFIGPANMSGRVTAIAVPDAPRHKTMYVGLASGGVWKTTNLGTTWRPIFNEQGFASIGDVTVAPSDGDVVWVGTGERNSLRSNGWGDGVYKTTDGGESWQHMGLERTREIGRIEIHPEDPEVVYVAAMGHLWGTGPHRGVYKTTDGGESWEKVLFVDDTTGFVDLEMNPKDPDVLYAAGWHRLRLGGGHMEGAGDGSGIWKTTDGGETWVELTGRGRGSDRAAAGAGAHGRAPQHAPRDYNARGLPTADMGRIGLAVHPRDPSVVYAIIQVARSAKNRRVSPDGGLFRSENAGRTWTRVHDFSALPDYYYNQVWVDPNDPDHIYLGATYLHESENGGRTISRVDVGRVHVDHHALWIDPSDSEHIVLGNDGGVYISNDGGETWSHQVIPASQFYEIDIDATKVPYHICGGTQDNSTWCGPSRTREEVGITPADWYAIFGGDGFHSAVSPDKPWIRYVEYQYGNIARLNTRTWEYTSIQPIVPDGGTRPDHPFRWDWDTPFILSQHDPTTLYLGANYLFKLTDRGRDWEILGPDMTRQNLNHPEPDSGYTAYHSLHSIAESPLDADVIWTGANDGLLWVTDDGGESWQNVTRNLAAVSPRDAPAGSPERCHVAEIVASRHDVRTAYVVYDCHKRDDYSPYVFKTTDLGRTWTDITGNLPDGAGSHVIVEDPVNPNLLFVGNERGLWASITGGNQWIRLKNDLPTAPVHDLEIVPRASELVVGTHGRSIYILDIHALERLTPAVLREDAHLFEVEPTRAYNTRDTYASFGDEYFTGENPPYGAVITYYLGEDVGHEVTLEICKPAAADGAGEGAASAQEDENGCDDPIRTIEASGRPGVHRVVWNLERKEPRPRRLGDPVSRDELREVLPGTYTVTLVAGDEEGTRTIVVKDGWVRKTPGRVR